jgi:hypothetical protein
VHALALRPEEHQQLDELRVVSSAAAGIAAGAAINADLVAEDTRRPVDHQPRRGRARPSLSRSERSPD